MLMLRASKVQRVRRGLKVKPGRRVSREIPGRRVQKAHKGRRGRPGRLALMGLAEVRCSSSRWWLTALLWP